MHFSDGDGELHLLSILFQIEQAYIRTFKNNLIANVQIINALVLQTSPEQDGAVME